MMERSDTIMNLQFYMPTKVVMGKDCVRQNTAQLAAFGTKALIVTGAHSAKANGSLDDVIAALRENGREYAVYDKVMANPTIACCYDGAKVAREEKADFIIAIGGGSPMDAAKGIALLACQDIAEENLFSGKYGDKALPMVFIPTTAGTGSEVTPYSVLINHKVKSKTSISSPLLFPKLSLLDAKYTMNMPLHTTINTAIDALSHAVEGMLTIRATSVTDTLAAESIRCISGRFEALKSGRLTYEDREQLLYGSMLAGMVIAHTGTTAVHAMGYSLTYFKNVDHGRANGLLLAEFLRFISCSRPDLTNAVLEPMGYSSIDQFSYSLNELLGQQESLTKEEVEQYTAISVRAKSIPNSKVVPAENDIRNIYLKSFNF